MKAWQLSSDLFILLVSLATLKADVAANFVGRNSCSPEFRHSARIRLDSSQKAYLMAKRLKAANILAIVQYEKKDETCGIIRDVVQSRDNDNSFVWKCYSQKARSAVVV
ncbi:MAG TPA: hypothetical protein VH088_07115, partial [Terriglobales bacterium]|nr:hypothetical protein [Terriglobales bacterium]